MDQQLFFSGETITSGLPMLDNLVDFGRIIQDRPVKARSTAREGAGSVSPGSNPAIRRGPGKKRKYHVLSRKNLNDKMGGRFLTGNPLFLLQEEHALWLK